MSTIEDETKKMDEIEKHLTLECGEGDKCKIGWVLHDYGTEYSHHLLRRTIQERLKNAKHGGESIG